ncbi:MAG: Helix-turn-helix transcriptional regulator [Thermoproteota archaeon]|nr:Helix-turn-helix transcriptional regulator [Thermoproteota archaeon]
MLYNDVKMKNKKTLISRIEKELQEGENLEDIGAEIEEYCNQCNPTNPMTCVESCEIWRLKGKYQGCIGKSWKQSDPQNMINNLKNDKRVKILEVLSTGAYSIEDLQQELREKGYRQSRSMIQRYVEPLVKLNLVREENDYYRLAEEGEKAYSVWAKSGFQELSANSRGYEEAILRMLVRKNRTHEDLTQAVPRRVLPRILSRLQAKELVVRSSPSGRVFFFAAKRRPTRRLSPTESKIFYALPKTGISAGELSKKIGINVRGTYRYLRRLRFKRHALKKNVDATFAITQKGTQLAEALDVVTNIIQNNN